MDTFFKELLDQKNPVQRVRQQNQRNNQQRNQSKSNRSILSIYSFFFRQQTTQRSEATNILENVLTNMLDQRVRTFLDDPNARQLQFEDSLSPFGRRYIHEVCQQTSFEKNFEEQD